MQYFRLPLLKSCSIFLYLDITAKLLQAADEGNLARNTLGETVQMERNQAMVDSMYCSLRNR